MILRHKTRLHIRIDKDVRNFIDAAGLNTDSNLNVAGLYTAEEVRMALHFFVSGLKNLKDTGQTQTVWERMKAVYVFIGGTASMHKFNLKDPRDLDVAFRLTFHVVGGGSITHSATGVLPNSVYADPYIVQTISETFGYGYYSRTNNTSHTGIEFDAYNGASGGNSTSLFAISSGGGISYYGDTSLLISSSAQPNTLGFYLGNRVGNILSIYKNGNLIGTGTAAKTTANGLGINLFRASDTRYSAKECAYAHITGSSITVTESQIVSQLVNNLQSSLKRNPFYS